MIDPTLALALGLIASCLAHVCTVLYLVWDRRASRKAAEIMETARLAFGGEPWPERPEPNDLWRAATTQPPQSTEGRR